KRYLNPYDIQAVDGVAVIEEEVCETSPSARFNNVLHTVTANGEYDKTTQGIFDNFLEVKCKDPYMDAVILGHEWLAMSDRLNQEISHSQNYIFMRYLPFLPVAFHMLFASNSHRRIQYPNTQYENFVKLNKTLNLLTSLLSGVTPATKRNAHTKVAVLDILPLLVEIMQPNIRPVNTQLYSTKEKEQLCNVVSTMIAYNLTYQQRRSPEGQYTYCLEPNIEEVVKFGGLPVKKQMTYATKQLIAREIELEKMRRSEGVTTKENKEQKNPVEANTGDKKQQSTVPRHKEKLQPKKFDIVEDQPTRDFFGRIVKVPLKENTGEQESEAEENKKSKRNNCVLWYKFHEGYTNAIRRNIQIKDLL
ncbi:chromosome transmission fidelity protein 18 homolog, partial [Saccoglossus kowalevskii]|uniref:Chromosome transmission fidelity protein 18 homolog n=1 Tax=Saccoglossus kowalevskii TaxID=10224 RepID=A0ABM0M465_SACKO